MPYLRTNNEMPIIPGYASGDIVTVDAAAAPLNKCVVDVVPVQSGTGDPSPTNVRPISGWSECNVTRTGVNLWDEEWEVGGVNVTTGANANFNDRIRSKNYIPIRPSISIYVKASSTYISVCFYDENKVFISGEQSSSAIRIAPSNAYFIRFSLGSDYGATYGNNVSVNYPSTDTSYHAYTGTTATIPLGSTYYGGSLDVTTGVLTIDKQIIGLGSSDILWGYNSIYNFFYAGISGMANSDNLVCSQYKVITMSQGLNDKQIKCSGSNGVYVMDTSYTDVQTFRTAMQNANAQIVYELATPTTVQLTPTEVKTLLGNNNIFADTGDVDIIYIRRSGT